MPYMLPLRVMLQVAMYYLVMFYEALAEDLKPFRPGKDTNRWCDFYLVA